MPNQPAIALFLSLGLVACATDIDDDLASPPDAELSILATDPATGTRGKLELDGATISFEVTRIVDPGGELHIAVVLADLSGAILGPGIAVDAGHRKALAALEQAADDIADATDALATDLEAVANAASIFASGGLRASTYVRSCTPDGGGNYASTQVVYTKASNGVYQTSGYYILYQRGSGKAIGPNSNEYVVGSEWSWSSPDWAPVGSWTFRSVSRRGVGNVSIKAIFDRAYVADPSCWMVHRL